MRLPLVGDVLDHVLLFMRCKDLEIISKTTLFCCWKTNKLGGATVHHSINKYFEVKGMLADFLTSMSDQLFS